MLEAKLLVFMTQRVTRYPANAKAWEAMMSQSGIGSGARRDQPKRWSNPGSSMAARKTNLATAMMSFWARSFSSVCMRREEKEDRKSTRLNSSHEWISYAV